jgi:hydrogenase maturation protease
MRRALVLACGNVQRGDDGVALQVANCLRRGLCDPETEIRCQTQWTPELAEPISKAELVIFVDAGSDPTPGSISCKHVVSTGTALPVTTHHSSPESLLLLADQLYGNGPAQAFLMTIAGARFEFEEGLSDPVRRAIPHAIERIKALLSGVTIPEE